MALPKINYNGQKIGKLRVVSCLNSVKGVRRWICNCDCGNITTVTTSALGKGGTRSCGCLGQEKLSKFRGSHGKSKYPTYKMWIDARRRAERFHLPFNIDVEDIIVPEFCPFLGIRLQKLNRKGPCPSSPSLDRIKPELGYVKGNIQVISHKANGLKGAATFEEMKLLLENWQKLLQTNRDKECAV